MLWLLASLAMAATIHVDEAAAPGGDGSIGAPFQRIQQGLDVSASGDTVLVAPGTYDGRAVVPHGVNLSGQGAGSTLLLGDGVNDCLRVGRGMVSHLELSQCAKAIFSDSDGGKTFVRDVQISDSGTALWHQSGHLVVDRVGADSYTAVRLTDADLTLRDSDFWNVVGIFEQQGPAGGVIRVEGSRLTSSATCFSGIGEFTVQDNELNCDTVADIYGGSWALENNRILTRYGLRAMGSKTTAIEVLGNYFDGGNSGNRVLYLGRAWDGEGSSAAFLGNNAIVGFESAVVASWPAGIPEHGSVELEHNTVFTRDSALVCMADAQCSLHGNAIDSPEVIRIDSQTSANLIAEYNVATAPVVLYGAVANRWVSSLQVSQSGMPLKTSPLRDHVRNSALPVDFYGVARDSNADAGAVEYVP